MSEPKEDELEEQEGGGVRRVVSGLGQTFIGAVEEVGGILTADPVTAAEGEFNIEVGAVREDAEEALGEEANNEGAESRRGE